MVEKPLNIFKMLQPAVRNVFQVFSNFLWTSCVHLPQERDLQAHDRLGEPFSINSQEYRSRFLDVLQSTGRVGSGRIPYAVWGLGSHRGPPARELRFRGCLGHTWEGSIPWRNFGGRTSASVKSGATNPNTKGFWAPYGDMELDRCVQV